MAIIDKNKYNWVDDTIDYQSIGLKMPIELDNGLNGLTTTTLDAVKQNVLNLCSTELGERVMQPNLGLRLKRFLFEPFTEDLIIKIQDTIIEGLNYWMGFININNIRVKMSDNESRDSINTMEVSIDFSLSRDNSTTESVQITINGE